MTTVLMMTGGRTPLTGVSPKSLLAESEEKPLRRSVAIRAYFLDDELFDPESLLVGDGSLFEVLVGCGRLIGGSTPWSGTRPFFTSSSAICWIHCSRLSSVMACLWKLAGMVAGVRALKG